MRDAEWTPVKVTGESPAPRGDFSLVKGLNNNFYLYGGTRIEDVPQDAEQTEEETYEDLWRFDTQTTEWKEIMFDSTHAPGKLSCHTAVVIGFKMFVFGGTATSVHCFNMETEEWVSQPTMQSYLPKTRFGHSAEVSGDKMYVFGGYSQASNAVFADLETYDTTTGVWKLEEEELKGVQPEARSGHGSCIMGSKMYIFGGMSEHDSDINELHVLDTETLTWSIVETDTAESNKPSARSNMSLVVADPVNNILLLFGGDTCVIEDKKYSDTYMCKLLPDNKCCWIALNNIAGKVPVEVPFVECMAHRLMRLQETTYYWYGGCYENPNQQLIVLHIPEAQLQKLSSCIAAGDDEDDEEPFAPAVSSSLCCDATFNTKGYNSNAEHGEDFPHSFSSGLLGGGDAIGFDSSQLELKLRRSVASINNRLQECKDSWTSESSGLKSRLGEVKDLVDDSHTALSNRIDVMERNTNTALSALNKQTKRLSEQLDKLTFILLQQATATPCSG